MAPKTHERPNSASAPEAASFVELYDRLEQQREVKLAELDAEFKKKKRELNKGFNNEQGAVLEDAKKVGVKKGVIRAIANGQKGKRQAQELLARNIERAEEMLDALEADERDFAISIRAALGEDFAGLPLGAAAVAREEGGPDATTAAVINAVKRSTTEEEWDKAKPKGTA